MDKTTTFQQLGIPFRLYEAPVETCSDFVGLGQCHPCKREHQWLFRAGIGDNLLVPCANCGQVNALSCSDKKDTLCKQCTVPIIWPVSREEEVHVCYDCLRNGRLWFTQDTQLGAMRWEDAQRGWTHGTPLQIDASIPLRPKPDEPDWYEYSLAPDDAHELGRTPGYISWQGEAWLFHCGRLMVYIGEPKTVTRQETPPEVVAAVESLIEREGWDLKGTDLWDSFLYVYLFRCPVCGALDGHVDCE